MSAARPQPIRTANRLLAVVDDREALDALRRRLRDAGIADADVVTLHGPADLERFRARSGGGTWSRAMRFLSFIAVDQAVDLAWYESALADGRTVVVLRVPRAEERRVAVAELRRAGAHFVNHYGRMATEDIVPWRGEPPPVHWIHHR